MEPFSQAQKSRYLLLKQSYSQVDYNDMTDLVMVTLRAEKETRLNLRAMALLSKYFL